MKFYKFLLPIFAFLGMATNVFAQIDRQQQDASNLNRDLSERDFDALEEYISGKRNVELKEKTSNLKISGDVRSQWSYRPEKGIRPLVDPNGNILVQNEFVGNGPYKQLRGSGKTDPYTINKATPRGLPLSKNDFDVEFNLYFKYEYKRAYAVAHLQFDNACGVSDNGWLQVNEDPAGYHGSGTGKELSLKRAYWGYKIYEDGCTRFDVEVGRHKLYDVFESEVQYSSRMDGIAFYYSGSRENIGEWYATLAAFVVDERVNHFAYGAEVGYMNIMDWGFDVQYSFVNWNKYGRNRFFVRNPNGFRFQTSQLTLTYHLNEAWLCGRPAEIFGAVLYNSDPHHNADVYRGTRDGQIIRFNTANHRKDGRQRWGWYLGCLIGRVDKEGDWSFEAQYQYMQAYVCPDDDVNGIGRGNVLEESLTYQRRSNANYKGWKFEGLYALTDNLTIDTKFEFTKQIKKSIGGPHRYTNFEIQGIYAF